MVAHASVPWAAQYPLDGGQLNSAFSLSSCHAGPSFTERLGSVSVTVFVVSPTVSGTARTVFSGCCSPVGLRTQAPKGSWLCRAVCHQTCWLQWGRWKNADPESFSFYLRTWRKWCRARCPSALWGCSESLGQGTPLVFCSHVGVWLGAAFTHCMSAVGRVQRSLSPRVQAKICLWVFQDYSKGTFFLL